jgi:hypothetical protein
MEMETVKAIIDALRDTPIPTIIVVGGLALLLLSVVGNIAGKIKVPQERQKWAAVIGSALVLLGIALHVVRIPILPTPTPGTEPVASETPTATAAATPTTPTPTATAAPTTPTPTATATQTPTPSPTPTPTPEPEFLVEGFESYRNDSELAEDFVINRNAGNQGRVSQDRSHSIQGLQAMAFDFEIYSSDRLKDYIGFDRAIPTQDWSGYSEFCFSIVSYGPTRKLVLQFGRYGADLKDEFDLSQDTIDYCIPLQNRGIDLRAVGYYGLYVAAPPTGSGVIYIDNIRLR